MEEGDYMPIATLIKWTVSTDHSFWRERRAEADSNEVPLLTV